MNERKFYYGTLKASFYTTKLWSKGAWENKLKLCYLLHKVSIKITTIISIYSTTNYEQYNYFNITKMPTSTNKQNRK